MKIRQKALEYLINLQMSNSKTKFMYHTEKIQKYLSSDEFSTTQKKILFKMRVKMSPNKATLHIVYFRAPHMSFIPYMSYKTYMISGL